MQHATFCAAYTILYKTLYNTMYKIQNVEHHANNLHYYVAPIASRSRYKANNKITELRPILQRESQNFLTKGKVYKQTKSVNNRKTVKTVIILTWYRNCKKNGGLESI